MIQQRLLILAGALLLASASAQQPELGDPPTAETPPAESPPDPLDWPAAPVQPWVLTTALSAESPAWPPRPDQEAPLGSGVREPAALGVFQLRYALRHEQGEDLRQGRKTRSEAAAFDAGYALAPVESTTDRHEFSAEYGLGEDLALHLVLPFFNKEITHTLPGGTRIMPRSSGLGDVRLGARWELAESPDQRLALGASLSIPTGSITRRGRFSTDQPERLPYALQLGSGTLDLWPELIWTRWSERWSYGLRASAALRSGTNNEDYSLGNRLQLSTWLARRIDTDHSLSLRLEVTDQDRIDGADDNLDPSLTPANDPESTGLFRVDAYLGVQYVAAAGHRFAAEFGGPLLQDADGIQLDTDLVAYLGWTYSF